MFFSSDYESHYPQYSDHYLTIFMVLISHICGVIFFYLWWERSFSLGSICILCVKSACLKLLFFCKAGASTSSPVSHYCGCCCYICKNIICLDKDKQVIRSNTFYVYLFVLQQICFFFWHKFIMEVYECHKS